MNHKIAIFGSTGNLGKRIVRALRKKNIEVIALVRVSSAAEKIDELKQLGATVISIDFDDKTSLTNALSGVSCVVSALSGLEDVIVDTQKKIVDAAVAAGVPRFIPSDFSLDFRQLPFGTNRNLDLRRTFHGYLDAAPIAVTSIFNGAFADMLTGQMPMILFKIKRILYWGSADQSMDFTTIADTAAFTAHVALDTKSSRFLCIAGSQLSARELATLVSELTGSTYGLFRPGSLDRFAFVIKLARKMAPGEGELYPAWQGMQYMHNMLDGRGAIKTVDNERYPEMKWHGVRDVLEDFFKTKSA